jgi:hypothetical protein
MRWAQFLSPISKTHFWVIFLRQVHFRITYS